MSHTQLFLHYLWAVWSGQTTLTHGTRASVRVDRRRTTQGRPGDLEGRPRVPPPRYFLPVRGGHPGPSGRPATANTRHHLASNRGHMHVTPAGKVFFVKSPSTCETTDIRITLKRSQCLKFDYSYMYDYARRKSELRFTLSFIWRSAIPLSDRRNLHEHVAVSPPCAQARPSQTGSATCCAR